VVSFEKAKGRNVEERDWHTNFFECWGEYIGRLHKVSREYNDKFQIRPQCLENYSTKNFYKASLPHDELQIITRKQHELFDYLGTLPKDKNTYGMIHGDFEDHNFFIQDNQINAFDFDSCHYNWFIYDVATILREATWMINQNEIKGFLHSFFKGYMKENKLTTFWLKQIPIFFKWIEINSYTDAYIRGDIKNLSEEEKFPLGLMRNCIVKNEPWDGLKVMVELLLERTNDLLFQS
jgi:Ser/Thr protein kinase RdoA (MazF antagonist)